jgi:hypothetical protein
MPAKLIVTEGSGTGTEVDIHDEVLRIGADDECACRLQGHQLAPHIATLEYREGEHVIHNKSNDPIEVNGQELGLRDFVLWPPGQEVRLGQDLTLRLEVEDDPAPSKPSTPVITYEYDAEAPDPQKEFDGIIAKLSKNKQETWLGPLSLRAALQSARASELRGDHRTARETYERIRDTLLARLPPNGKFRNPEDQEVWDFVQFQLESLRSGPSF